MSSRDWQLRIQDILAAINSIQTATAGMTYDTFATSDVVVKAVLYDLIVIGEATTNISPAIQERYSDIPWRLMKDMRNVAAHEYFQIDVPKVWRTLQRDLSPLQVSLTRLLAAEIDNLG